MSGAAVVIDLIEAFRRSKTMFAAVSLGVFDRLGGDGRTSADLAAELGADEGALERLLDGCRGLGLLDKTGSGTYRNTEAASTYLRRESPETLAGYVLYSDRVLYRLWGDLEGAVREGTHRWGGAADLFSNFFATEETKRDFLAGMHGFGRLSSPVVAAAFDLSRYRRMADLGGATGHLALALKERYPAMDVCVFDLPAVVGSAKTRAIAGDFFADPLPEADLYALGRILHDWPDDKVRRLLARIFEALPEGGALLVAERLLDGDKAGPVPALMQSLNMLVCTEGKERTEAEYAALLTGAGFRSVQARRTASPLDAILAVK